MSSAAAPTAAPLLAVDRVTVRYGAVCAVSEIDLSIGEDSVVGLIGPNGAGKTSLIDALSGYQAPTAGTVMFAGADVTGLRPHLRARAGLARTFQSVELFDDLTVEENLLVAAEHVGVAGALRDLVLPVRRFPRETIDWALATCGLAEVAHRRPTELSHGRRKLVGVARALAARPRLVLLDEPAAGLDTDESMELGRHLRGLPDHGVAVLLIDHDMGLVLNVCDHVYVLDSGKLIAQGTPAQIRQNDDVVRAYLGTQKDAGNGH